MSNPLFQQYGGNTGNPMMNMIQQFMQFRRNFTGNAQQQVQALLNSGKISPERYNAAVQTAQQLQQMMNGIR